MRARALTAVDPGRLLVVVGVLSLPLASIAGVAALSELTDGLVRMSWVGAVPALIAYLAAHALRVARTLVVLGGSVRSVRLVALAHATSAPWTGLLPFKVGELVRFDGQLLRRLQNGLVRSYAMLIALGAIGLMVYFLVVGGS